MFEPARKARVEGPSVMASFSMKTEPSNGPQDQWQVRVSLMISRAMRFLLGTGRSFIPFIPSIYPQ